MMSQRRKIEAVWVTKQMREAGGGKVLRKFDKGKMTNGKWKRKVQGKSTNGR